MGRPSQTLANASIKHEKLIKENPEQIELALEEHRDFVRTLKRFQKESGMDYETRKYSYRRQMDQWFETITVPWDAIWMPRGRIRQDKGVPDDRNLSVGDFVDKYIRNR